MTLLLESPFFINVITLLTLVGGLVFIVLYVAFAAYYLQDPSKEGVNYCFVCEDALIELKEDCIPLDTIVPANARYYCSQCERFYGERLAKSVYEELD
jgi:hypothetical protein